MGFGFKWRSWTNTCVAMSNLVGLGEWILKGVLLDSRGGVRGTEKKKKKK